MIASAASSAAELDAFGNVLCITSHDASPLDTDAPSKLKCCTLGCAFSVQALDAPSDHFLFTGTAPSGTTDVPRPAGPIFPASRDYDPGNPRAPPAA